jgi:hypothetical protein
MSRKQAIRRPDREEAKGTLARNCSNAVWPACARPNPSHPSIAPRKNRLLIALLSGALATAVNMAILETLRAASIETTHGGLLRLLSLGVIRVVHSSGVNLTYSTAAQLLFVAGWFQEGFHIVTGLLMAVVYVFFWNSGADLHHCCAVSSMAQRSGC